ncbi:MAG: PEGA domain-containing protein [bacterium]
MFAQLVVGCLILSVAFGIIYYAQGYRFNYRNFRIIKTGIVNVTSTPRDAEVFVDGKIKSKKTPYYVNLTAGPHTVSIKKEGYYDWQTTYMVEAEMVNVSKNILLIKNNISPQVLTDTKKLAALHAPVDMLAKKLSNDLSYSDYEIWVEDDLIARFSTPISHVVWLPDYAHIVYQQGNQIRVIEASGQNDTLLIEMKNSNITNIVFGEKYTEMYYTDGDVDMVAVIR